MVIYNIQTMSMLYLYFLFQGTEEWFKLQHTKSGEVQLSCNVTACDTIVSHKHIL